MAINFACEQCGKQMQAKEEFGGRRMRCPGCGTVLTIPAPPKPMAPPPAPPSRRPPAAHLEPRPAISAPAPPPAAPAAPARRVIPAPPPPAPDPEPLVLGAAEIGEEKKGLDDDPALRTPLPRRNSAGTLSRPDERENVWVDRSLFLDQVSTPWSEEDLKRWGINPNERPQGGSAGVVLLVLVLLLLIGASLTSWIFWPQVAAMLR